MSGSRKQGSTPPFSFRRGSESLFSVASVGGKPFQASRLAWGSFRVCKISEAYG